MSDTPKVGVAVFIVNEEGKILLGQRHGDVGHAHGFYSLPGGHMDIYDFDSGKGDRTPEDAAKREVLEETGLEVELLGTCEYAPFLNVLFPEEKKHYIGLYFAARIIGGKLENKEPNKNKGWNWVSPDELPSPLFPPLEYHSNHPCFKIWIEAKARAVRVLSYPTKE